MSVNQIDPISSSAVDRFSGLCEMIPSSRSDLCPPATNRTQCKFAVYRLIGPAPGLHVTYSEACAISLLAALGGVDSGAGTKDLCGLFRPGSPRSQDPCREQLSRWTKGMYHHHMGPEWISCVASAHLAGRKISYESCLG